MKKQSPLGRGLGKGIDLLIHTGNTPPAGSSISEIQLSRIHPNPAQPRAAFDQDALQELAASIRAVGVIQPITLRETPDGNYMIISGERRFRAAKIAGKDAIPAYLRTDADENVMEMALIENIQREDLNAIEIALAYQNLISAHGLTQEQLSERVGKKRATIANYLRLIKLPAEIQIALKDRKIEMGHARALLAVDDPQTQLEIYWLTLAEGLSVRSVEEMARQAAQSVHPDTPENIPPPPSRKASLPQYAPFRERLSRFLDAKVRLACNRNGSGHISIPFHSPDDLDRLISLFNQTTPEPSKKNNTPPPSHPS
jgi:ParB family chromosome partitioning protein